MKKQELVDLNRPDYPSRSSALHRNRSFYVNRVTNEIQTVIQYFPVVSLKNDQMSVCLRWQCPDQQDCPTGCRCAWPAG
jgi:hypothetical protein